MVTPSPLPSPALAPPPGQTSNFGSADVLWKWNVLCQTACLLFPGIAVILRTYIRIWVKRVWVLEDCRYLFCRQHSVANEIYLGLCCLAFVGSLLLLMPTSCPNIFIDWTGNIFWPSEHYYIQAWRHPSVDCDKARSHHHSLCKMGKFLNDFGAC